MTNAEIPAENTGGNTATSTTGKLAELPARVRVHALAKLLGSNSRELLGKLTELGESARSAQSSVSRDVALRVAEALGLTEEQPAAEQPAAAPIVAEPAVAEQPVEAPPVEPVRRRKAHVPVFAAPSPIFLPPEPAAAPVWRQQPEPVEDPEVEQPQPVEDLGADDDGDDSGRRRRRRGRRGRGRGKGGDEGGLETDEESSAVEPSSKRERGRAARNVPVFDDAEADADDAGTEDENAAAEPLAPHSDADADVESDGDDGASRRRRRRRRRKGGDEDPAEAGASGIADDPPNTVVHVRQSKGESDRAERSDRPAKDEVRSVRGSTRLEAKRQRRRDGREAGRRRAPILSEAEFLARREAVERAMVVLEKGNSTQIGVLEDGVLVEHFVTDSSTGSIVGNIYLGRVQNVLPSMEAAFIDIGRGRNAVLYAGEVDWDAAGLEGKARKIEQALSSGDSVLVQVTKDPVGHKGARLTTQISLAGRFLVYVPAGGATGISRKLPDNERRRLKDILKRIVPEDAGVIIRTASEGISEEELARDVNRLTAQWAVIKEKADAGNGNGKKSSAPTMLYEEPDLLVKVVRDLFTEDFSTLEIQGNNAWETIHGYVEHVAPDLADRLKRYTGTGDAFADHRIDEQITKALDRKVWLPSGGYLVIDRTEAMTVIDVNTGKFTGSGGNLEETVTRNNLESAEEIVRQLRLRDIGGIIVIDFIDMVLESNRELVLRRLTECLGRDRTRHQVAEVTSLGLVQMTRKKIGTGLLEAFSTPCEPCKGRGVVVSTEPQRISGGTQNSSGHSQASAPSTAGNAGGGQQQPSRRSRGRGKGEGTEQDDTPAITRPEPVVAVPTPEQRESVVSAVQAMAHAAKVAKAEEEHAPAEHAQQDEEQVTPAQQADAAQLNGHAHAAEPAVDQTPAAEVVTGRVGAAAAKTAPATSPAPVAAGSDAEAGETTPELDLPVPAIRPTRRRPRRAASRPAGPPVTAGEKS
jgi:ribonuclease E